MNTQRQNGFQFKHLINLKWIVSFCENQSTYRSIDPNQSLVQLKFILEKYDLEKQRSLASFQIFFV